MGKVVCLSDVHGNALTLRRLLERLRLKREEDVLVILGDCNDRGPDTKGVFDLILQLQRDGYAPICCRGNHEQLLLDAAISGVNEDLILFLENGGDQTLFSFGVDHPSRVPKVYLDFISSMPLYWQNETHIFVHASLPCELKEPISARHRHEMLWQRTTWTDPTFLHGKRLVTGHCIKSLREIRASLKTSHIFADNGCMLGAGYKGGSKGNLVAVDLGKNEIFVQPCLDMAPANLY